MRGRFSPQQVVVRRSLLLPSTVLTTGQISSIGRAIGASTALAAVELAENSGRPLLVLATDPRHADQLEAEIRFFAERNLQVKHFVEWETLPYDSFSPHQDIVSDRLSVMASMPQADRGIVIASAPSLLQRLPPVDYIAARSLHLRQGRQLDRDDFIERLTACGYLRVPQVTEHGEIAVRGSLLDVFPMGSEAPVRVDFFDDDVESLRYFDPETQLSAETTAEIRILPAREIPLDEDDVGRFRRNYRARFEGQPAKSRVYREISEGIAHGGIEYYLPLFFETTASLFDYLPDDSAILAPAGINAIFDSAWAEIGERYELCSLDPERPVLKPQESFHQPAEIAELFSRFRTVSYSAQSLHESKHSANLSTKLPPAVRVEARYEDAAASLMRFLENFDGRVLITADSAGRREGIIDMMRGRGREIARFDDWQAFLLGSESIGIAIAPIEGGVLLPANGLAIITEHQLIGEKPRQRSRRRRAERDPETIIRELNDLAPGAPVVHSEYGVGRYVGLETLKTGGVTGEFLSLEYADGDKLYVPVTSLDLISRYTGASPENAPLHKLGSDLWANAWLRAIR